MSSNPAGDAEKRTRASGGPVRSRSRHAVFAIVTLLLSLALIEGLTRVFLPGSWIVPRRPAEDAFLETHPVRSYAFRKSFTNRWHSDDYDVEVRLNELGLRDGPISEVLAGKLRILALGDSYTFGIGVEGDQNWPGVLEHRLQQDLPPDLHPTVLDAGIPAYSARQIRQSAEELIPLIHPQIVIFGMYASSYWRVENPYQIFGQTLITADRVAAMSVGSSGELLITAFEPGVLRTLDLWFKQHLHVAAHFLAFLNGGRHWPDRAPRDVSVEQITYDYAPVLVEIGKLDRLTRGAGAYLIVLPINAQEADGAFSDHEATYNSILREYCLAQQILFVDPLPSLVEQAHGRPLYRFENDGHWTPAAHVLAAGLLEKTIVARGLEESPAAGGAQMPPAHG